MSTCRIFLFTYKRNNLLPRAIKNIINQTFTDWVCEVHNDAPDDSFPVNYISSLNDKRFIVKDHNVNIGATASFNLAFTQPVEEGYATILEDDNWWEPSFLEIMINALRQNEQVEVAVANEQIWREEKDGKWTDTYQAIWPEKSGVSLYNYELIDKCGSARICNSSMVWKTGNAKQWHTPDDIPMDVTEHFRERLMPHPILLVHQPLVNYAMTIYTSRANTLEWSRQQVLLISSVFYNLDAGTKATLADRLWEKAQTNSPFKTTLMHVALANKDLKELLLKIKPVDYFRYFLTCLKSPVQCYHIINAKTERREHWNFLVDNIQ